MQGYQFAHMEVYSAKGAPAGRDKGTAKRKNGQRIWTAQEILDEAERLEHASLHVPDGRPAPEILPGEVDSFDALRKAHAKASSVKEAAFERVGKTGRKQTVRRKLRADAASLYTCVVSLPVLTEDALRDPELKADCMALLHAALEHERGRIEDLGGTMMLGVTHWDESHVHAHLYALDMKIGRVDHLHPGRAAKKAFLAEHAESGREPRVLNRAGNMVYCNAMREWQDDFHEGVFRDAGLLHYGPRRERLPTAAYNHAKTAAAERAADAERQRLIREERQALKKGWQRLGEANAEELKIMAEFTDHMAEERAEAAAFHASLVEDSVALDRRQEALDGREDKLDKREKKVIGREADAVAREAAAEKREAEAEAGLAAIEAMAAGLLMVDGEGTDSRVRSAPGAMKHPLWAGLWARISPARQAAAQVARKVQEGLQQLRRKAQEEGLDAARKEARDELEGARTAMESAIQAAGRIGGIARAFAAKLSPADRARMEGEIDAAARDAASARIRAELASGLGARGDLRRAGPRGDARTE
jgi:hypothetical protein